MSLSPLDHPALPDIVSAAMAYVDRGEEPPIEELCGEYSDLAEAVRDCLGYSERLPDLRREPVLSDELSGTGKVLVGRYRLDAPLGAGAMGLVFRARDLELGRPVAVKILRAITLGNREAEARFAREAEALAALHHPSIVGIHDRGETEDGDPFLVMDLLEGLATDELMEEAQELGGPREIEDACWLSDRAGVDPRGERSFLRCVVTWGAELAAGLEAAHAAGIIHRDVKPSNVLVQRDGRAVLLDFSIATQRDAETLTRTGATVGTPAYMAPECLEARRAPSASLDIYGLGATLYHWLTLRAPYEGTPTQVLRSLATRDPRNPARVRPGLPRDLQAIVEKAMHRSPRARYTSARELEADLRAYLAHQPIRARATTPLTRGLRRLGRSRTAQAVLTVTLLLLGGLLFREWSEYAAQARHESFWSEFRRMPPNLALVDLANRATTSPEEYESVRGILDRSLAADGESLAGRLASASFWLDHGEPRRAASDVRVLAATRGTAYVNALARCYEQLPREASGASALDLASLPEPESPDEIYLAAYHALRSQDYARGLSWLEDPALDDVLPARELRLVFANVRLDRVKSQERLTRALANFEQAVALEQACGRRTAATAQIMGYALFAQQRYVESLDYIEQGLALAPASHVLLVQGGRTANALERYDLSRDYYQRALALRPKYGKAADYLVDALTELRSFDEAEAVLDEWGDWEGAASESRLLARRARLELTRALVLFEEGRLEDAQTLARDARERLDRSVALGETRDLSYEALSDAIEANDRQRLFESLARSMAEAPARAVWLRNLLQNMPSELDEESTQALRAYLERLVTSLHETR